MISILIIDRNSDEIAAHLGGNKQRSAFKVYSANTVEKGYEIAEKILPDSIVIEHNAIMNNNFETVRNLQTRLTTSNIPIILLGQDNNVNTILEAKKNGVKGYMIRPFTRDGFIEHIKRVNELAEKEKMREKTSMKGGYLYRKEDNLHVFYFLYKMQQQMLTNFFQDYVKSVKSLAKDTYVVFDIRHLYFPEPEEMDFIKKAVEAVTNQKVRMVSGKNYVHAMPLDLSLENELFIGKDDLLNYVRMHDAGEIDF